MIDGRDVDVLFAGCTLFLLIVVAILGVAVSELRHQRDFWIERSNVQLDETIYWIEQHWEVIQELRELKQKSE